MINHQKDLYTAIDQALKKHANHIALTYYRDSGIEKITHQQLLEKVERASQAIRQLPLTNNDRIAIIAETSIQWVIAFLSLLRLKLTVVLIDPTLPLEDIQSEIEFAEVSAVVVSDAMFNKGVKDFSLHLPVILSDQQYNIMNMDAMNKQHTQTPLDNVAVMIFTSGTTGKFKSVMLSESNILYVAQHKELLELVNTSFSILPFYHIAGLDHLLNMLLGGSTLNFIEKIDLAHITAVYSQSHPVINAVIPRFLEFLYNKIIEKIDSYPINKRKRIYQLMRFTGFIKRYTKINMGPYFFKSIYKMFGGNLRVFVVGGAPVKPKIQEFFQHLGFTVMVGYGLSETSGCIVITTASHDTLGSTGQPLTGSAIKIASKDANGVGEICLKSPAIMQGYFKNKELSAACMEGAWFHTGDLGRLDHLGNLLIVGRVKDLIVTAGGKKATPDDIEKHYFGIKDIEELAVVGIPNPSNGLDDIYAAVIINSLAITNGASQEQITNNIKQNIAERAGKLPTQFRIQFTEFFLEFPRTTGLKKIIRTKLISEIINRKGSRVTPQIFSVSNDPILSKIIARLAKIVSLHPQEINPDVHFTEYGVDSLLALNIIQALREEFGEAAISADKLLKNPTIREFAADVTEKLQTPPNKAPTNKVSELSMLNIVRQNPTPAQTEEPLANLFQSTVIFLTGGTGVLGGYLTKLILETTNKKLYMLVRAKDHAAAKKKVIDILTAYATSAKALQRIDEQICFILGDVTLPYFGLTLNAYEKLAKEVDITIHAAAMTSLHGVYETLIPVNLLGTKQMIDFALKTPQKFLAYISTYSIIGNLALEKHAAFTEKDFDVGQTFKHMGYQQTKFEAEHLVRNAKTSGLNWLVIRPGDIFGDSKTGCYPLFMPQLTGIFYDIFKTVIETGMAADSSLEFDITPIDYVAEGILYFVTQYPAIFGTYHLNHPHPKPYNQVIDDMIQCGYAIQKLSPEVYFNLLKEEKMMVHGKPYHSRTTELLRFNPYALFAKHGTQVDASFTKNILASRGMTCPPIDKSLIQTYLNYCKKIHYINPSDNDVGS